MLDSIYHKSLKLLKNHIFRHEHVKIVSSFTQRKITKSVNHHFNAQRYFTHKVI